jgi:membrane protease YdiL (CAAX protease family)
MPGWFVPRGEWLYHRSGSLLAPWVSHALVDAALVVIGWDVLRRG